MHLNLFFSAPYWFQGVAIDVLGVFYVLRKHSSEMNVDVVAPKFHLSERVAQAQGISHANRDIPGKAVACGLGFPLQQRWAVSQRTSSPCPNARPASHLRH